VKVLPPPAITTENFFMILPPSWWFVRSKENLSSGFQLVAHLGNVQADDDLNPVAAAHYPVGAQRFKDVVVTLRFRHIDQRDAQSGGAVVDAFDVAGAAERLQEASGLPSRVSGAAAAVVLPRAA
jgi:hypothetical protein